MDGQNDRRRDFNRLPVGMRTRHKVKDLQTEGSSFSFPPLFMRFISAQSA